ncbi:MAG: hypothetical protein SOY07_03280 [Bacteroidales bacterium]|nr:hypothetical protein [Bacteroidales bacterium]
MEQTFESILESMLEELDKDPSQDVDALIQKKMEEVGLSAEGNQMLKETNEMLASFEDEYAQLVEAKAKGQSRQSWYLQRMDTIMEGCTEEEKAQIATELSEATEKVIKQNLAEEAEDIEEIKAE